MKPLVTVTLLLALAFVLSRRVFSARRVSLLGLRQLFLSGTEFLLVGFLIGPGGLDLVGEDLLRSLDPLLHLALGWAGLTFGLQFDWRMLRLYATHRYAFAFAQALATAAIAAFGAGYLLPYLLPGIDGPALAAAAALIAITAAPSAPTSFHYFARLFRLEDDRSSRLVKFVVGVDAIPAVLLLGVLAGLPALAAPGAAGTLPVWIWWLAGPAFGIGLGIVLTALAGLKTGPQERLLFVVGIVAVASGLAVYLETPAIYLSFFCGLTVANLSYQREALRRVAAHAEHPIYIVFLVLAGTLLVLDRRVVALAAALVAVRLVGKLLGNVPWRWLGSERQVESPWLGLAVLAQGAMTVALAVDFHATALGAAGELGRLALSAVLLAVMFNEILSPLFIRRLFPSAVPIDEEDAAR